MWYTLYSVIMHNIIILTIYTKVQFQVQYEHGDEV